MNLNHLNKHRFHLKVSLNHCTSQWNPMTMATPWCQKLHQQSSVDVSCTCHEAEEEFNDHNPVHKTCKENLC